MSRPLDGILVIALAGYYAAISRFTWTYAPGLWAGLLAEVRDDGAPDDQQESGGSGEKEKGRSRSADKFLVKRKNAGCCSRD